jgi:hypothetical protein
MERKHKTVTGLKANTCQEEEEEEEAKASSYSYTPYSIPGYQIRV